MNFKTELRRIREATNDAAKARQYVALQKQALALASALTIEQLKHIKACKQKVRDREPLTAADRAVITAANAALRSVV